MPEISEITPKDMQRFWPKVKKTNNCWLWTATKTQGGYGKFYFRQEMGLAHRFSYEIFKGDIPKKLTIDHLCKNTLCVNPEHLEAITQKENVKRGLTGKIKHYNSKKTHCSKGHPFSGYNLIIYRNYRKCRTCNVQMIRIKRQKVRANYAWDNTIQQ